MPKINRKAVKRTAVILLTALLFVVIGIGYVNWQWKRTVVTIDNKSGRTMKSLKIFLNDGDCYDIDQISSGRSYLTRISPRFKAGLWVTFASEQDRQTITSPQIYICSLENRPRLTIGKNGAMKWDHTGWLFTPPADNFDLFEKVRKP